jgi:hypothetical protein
LQACFKWRDVSSLSFKAMDNVIVDLASALRERLAIVHDEQSRQDASTHFGRLKTVSEKIDKLVATLPAPVDPQLAHYLKRKSYDKALEFLEANR